MKIESYKVTIIIQVIVTGIYAILLLSNLIANENTADNVKRHEEEVAYIKIASSRVKALVGKVSNKKANKEIERAYDTLHSSPSKTIATVRSVESNVMNKIAELERAVSNQDITTIITIAGEIVDLMEERNRKVKLSQ